MSDTRKGIAVLMRSILMQFYTSKKNKKANKSERWMPRLKEAMKDVISCDKLRVGANNLRSADFRMGQPNAVQLHYPANREANPGN